jgi:rubrerythrin
MSEPPHEDHPLSVQEQLQLAVELETALSELYHRFAYYFPADEVFWQRLSGEEKRHAAMLNGLNSVQDLGMMPADVLFPRPQELRVNLQAIRAHIDVLRAAPPELAAAFRLALACELSASELHYQTLMTANSDSPVIRTMQDLGRADRDHIRRLRIRMKRCGIADG